MEDYRSRMDFLLLHLFSLKNLKIIPVIQAFLSVSEEVAVVPKQLLIMIKV